MPKRNLNEDASRRGRKIRRYTALSRVLIFVLLSVIAFSSYRLWEARQMYAQGDNVYETLSEAIKQAPPTSDPPVIETVQADEKESGPLAEIPALGIDFEALRSVNEDAVAWLYSPNTVIDYPVMRADDYNQYLRHLPDGTYNANGSLFLDYHCAADFSDRLSIVYGHHMKSGKMFASLAEYKKQRYFDEHPCMYLYTEQANYRMDILYGCVISAEEWHDRGFVYETNLEDLLSYARRNTSFQSSANYTETDRFLILSTCSYDFDDARYIVIGVLRPQYSEKTSMGDCKPCIK